MLLIAQILFTVLAWIRGWKWKALLPLGIGLPVILMITFALRNDLYYSQLRYIALGGDVIITIALIIMTVRPPQKAIEGNNND